MTEVQQQPLEFVQPCECGRTLTIRVDVTINNTNYSGEDTPAASGERGKILPPKKNGYFNPNSKAQSPAVKPPTPGQLEFARDICSVVNKTLSKECEESYDACYRFIGGNKAEFYDKKPKKPAAAGAGAGAKPATATACKGSVLT